MSTSKKLFSQNLFLLVVRDKVFLLVFVYGGGLYLILMTVGQPLMSSLLWACTRKSRPDDLTGGAICSMLYHPQSSLFNRPALTTSSRTFQQSQDLKKIGKIKKFSILDGYGVQGPVFPLETTFGTVKQNYAKVVIKVFWSYPILLDFP